MALASVDRLEMTMAANLAQQTVQTKVGQKEMMMAVSWVQKTAVMMDWSSDKRKG